MANGQYPITFSVHDSGSVIWCKDLCLQYTWCLASQYEGGGCYLVTDTEAFIMTGGNTFTDDNDQWGATRTFDDKSYTTYCGGSGQAGACRSVFYEFSGGLLNSRSGYHCYVKKLAPPPPNPPPPNPPPPDPDYSYLGEGECRMANGQYPITFSVHDSGSVIWCKDLCLQYTWCLASQYEGGGCYLVTDTEAFIMTGGNTFTDDNDQWGATRTFDDKSYTTYCGGSGQAGACRSVFYEFSGGLLNSRSGYHCYVKKLAPPPPNFHQYSS
mgnify:CR=1 FL=1